MPSRPIPALLTLLAAFLAGQACAPGKDTTLTAAGVRPGEKQALVEAASYSKAHRGMTMLVMRKGKVIFEDYAGGVDPGDAMNLYSGTKSFNCAIVVAAVGDGLVRLDEPVADTITEWKGHPRKSKITVRQLLTLTSGLDAGRIGDIPTYADAPQAEALHEPGTHFQYGPVPFQVFGELMSRKLASTGEMPVDYLERRVLDPIGLKVETWRQGKDGNPKLSAGAFLAAREWAKYGQLILDGGAWKGKKVLDADLLAQCFEGTKANPGYGIAFWLPSNPGGITWLGEEMGGALDVEGPVLMAAGMGKQRLYILPSRGLVIVRQARRRGLGGFGFKDSIFLPPIMSVYSEENM
jgi:CubicO group peptidase (beta-lactamase class C family)